jgi:hypothetical protein
MAESESKRSNWFRLTLLILIVGVAPFVPITLTVIEGWLFNSHDSEGIWRFIGVHEPLRTFYQWLGIL